MDEKGGLTTLEELNSEETRTRPNSGSLSSGIVPVNEEMDSGLLKELIHISESVDFSCKVGEFNPQLYEFSEMTNESLDSANLPSRIPDYCFTGNPQESDRDSAIPSCRSRKTKVKKTKHASVPCLDKLRNKNGKPLKGENIRYQIVRGMKKCARQLTTETSSDKLPAKGIHQVDLRDAAQVKLWGNVKKLVQSNQAAFALLGCTENGPSSDGKTKRTGSAASEKSCNDSYCKRFYSDPLVSQLHYHYIQLVYGEGPVKPRTLCQKLAAYCCNGHHTAACEAVWKDVKHYYMFEMLQKLGCQPYHPSDSSSDSLMEGNSQEFSEFE